MNRFGKFFLCLIAYASRLVPLLLKSSSDDGFHKELREILKNLRKTHSGFGIFGNKSSICIQKVAFSEQELMKKNFKRGRAQQNAILLEFGAAQLGKYLRLAEDHSHNNIIYSAMDLYYTAGSAPCRVVLLVAAALDLQLNLKELNLQAGEHLTPDFLKLNPQHTVPTLVDGGFPLWESRAISRYLINKYDNKELYPEDIKTRALIDQRLDFDLGTLYPTFSNFFYPQIFAGKPADDGLFHKLEEALDNFNSFLKGHKYAVGDTLTLADLSLVATVSTLDAAGVNLDSYPRVEKWFELVKATAPGYEEVNEKGIKNFKALVANRKTKTEL